MVDFKAKDSVYRSVVGCGEEYRRITRDMQERLGKLTENKISVGYALKAYYDSNVYRWRCNDSDVAEMCPRSTCSNCSSRVFFAVCELDFGLDKSQVSRLINIVDEFGDEKGDLLDYWKPFKWTVLREMLPLTYEQRKQIKPDWSIRRVREFKKNLVATGQQKNDQEEINFEALDAAIAGEPEGKYDKCKPAELRNILRQRDDEIVRLKNEVREFREGDKFKKMQEEIEYYKRLAIQFMASEDAAET